MVQPENPLVQKPETLKLNEFLKETVFFCIFCFSFVLFVFKFRATGILCFRNWLKYATGNTKSDRMLNFSLIAYHSRILTDREGLGRRCTGTQVKRQMKGRRTSLRLLVKFLT